MLDLTLDFHRQQAHDLAHVLAEIVAVQITPAEVARVHQVEHQVQHLDDGLARRQILLRDVQPPWIGLIAAEQIERQLLERGGLWLHAGGGVHGRQATACIFSTSSKSPSNSGPLK